METFFGANNTLWDYLLVAAIYGMMFLLIRVPKPRLELNYRANYTVLVAVWAFLMFTGNYLFYRLGVMAFLPWFNNAMHSFVWVGLCLGWLYYTTHHRPMWEQVLLFVFTSFVVKMAEKLLLGSWSMDRYLGIENQYAYLVAMSVVDGCYPLLSRWLLRWLGRRSTFGVYEPGVA